jgi:hypothetical protein
MSPLSALHFIETDRTARPRYRAVSRASVGFYVVALRPDGQWSAEHTLHGLIGEGSFASKELAIRACGEDEARREKGRKT